MEWVVCGRVHLTSTRCVGRERYRVGDELKETDCAYLPSLLPASAWIFNYCRHFQDIVTRYAHQSGFHVERRFGWDCHGLPVEYEIDKTLDIKVNWHVTS